MRKIRLAACLLTVAVLAITVHAGWYRTPGSSTSAGKTSWNADVPSPISLWQRDMRDDLYPTEHPIVFAETYRWYDSTNAVNTTGLWAWDANGDVVINSLGATYSSYELDTAMLNPWFDVEFRVDTNADIYARL